MRRRQASVTGNGRKAALQVLDRAFGVLDLFTAQSPEWSVTSVALALDLPLSTTHRILGVLQRHGYLRRDPMTRRFRLGVAAVDLGARARNSLDPQAVFVDALRGLAEATGETAILCTLDATGEASFCVDRIESNEPLRLSVTPGRTLPLHAGAMGKALLAFLPHDDQEQILTRPLERLCRRTITSRSKLRSELDGIAERGYATSFEETNDGLWGVAVPILDARGSAYASIGTAGPILRHSPERLAREVKNCHEAAGRIAAALGLAVWQAPAAEREAASTRSREIARVHSRRVATSATSATRQVEVP